MKLMLPMICGLVLCGCEKREDSSARQIKQLTQQIVALQAQQARQFESLSNLVTALSVRTELNFKNTGEYMETNFSTVDSNGSLRATAISERMKLDEAKISYFDSKVSGIQDSLAALDIKVDGLKTQQDFTRDKLDQIFNVGMETEKNTSDISIKLHAY